MRNQLTQLESVLRGDAQYGLHHGDCIEHMAEIPDAVFDFSVFSPPFPSVFAYTSEACDMGNSEDLRNEVKLHFGFFFNQLRRIIKPGRVIIVHCQNIPAMARNGETSTFDFRGFLIRMGKRAGLLYDSDWPVTKNPQAQAIRTHSHKLLFVTLERDSVSSTPAFQDHLIKFRIPGENAIPVKPTVTEHDMLTRNDWIEWAEGAWSWREIRETDTLNTTEGKGQDDTKHICPLQLGVINRVVRLYTNPGEVVFTPFGGIGSELYESIKLGRRAYGCEIKDEYYKANIKNCERATMKLQDSRATLFDFTEEVPCEQS